MALRVALKMVLRKFRLIPSFCRHCGRNVHDFVAPSEVWEKVDPHIKHGHTLCYDCFCEVCTKLGMPNVWRLEAVT
jgi:hypothetical protein